MEGAILQVALQLTEIKASIASTKPEDVAESYSLEKAKNGIKALLESHREWKSRESQDN